MGTNYYFHSAAKCHTCYREVEGVHIGKSSGGWCFAVHVMPEERISSWRDWLNMFESYDGSYIKNEYGEVITVPEMIKIVEKRSWPKSRTWTKKDYDLNHAKPGPNGLVRHVVDGEHCVGNGRGTYDYIKGEFS